jgi:hypothetical protein
MMQTNQTRKRLLSTGGNTGVVTDEVAIGEQWEVAARQVDRSPVALNRGQGNVSGG